jgi:excisionase family DNA binding protein
VANLSIEIDDGLLEQIAERAARLLEQHSEESANNYLDISSAAAFLACPRSRIYSLVSARRLPHHRDGSRLLFDRSELRHYVETGGASRP